MTMEQILDLMKDALWTTIKVAGPILIVALVVGLSVSLIQALTQIQEMTLAFVPKIVCVFIALIVFLPFMSATLGTFTQEVFAKIASGGG